MALLHLRGVVKGYGARTILEGLDFDVEPGCRVGVIGANGGGKSTLMRILAGLEQPDGGEATQRRGLVVEARERMEQLMRRFDGAVVAVSHDRYLLDETVSEIAELDGGRIRMWPGNYSAYTVARELELERQQQAYVTQQKEIARLEEAIRRFKDWAHRVPDERHIKQARNKQRQIDRMEKIDRPVLERRKIALELRPHARGGERVVELDSVGVELGGQPILVDVE